MMIFYSVDSIFFHKLTIIDNVYQNCILFSMSKINKIEVDQVILENNQFRLNTIDSY